MSVLDYTTGVTVSGTLATPAAPSASLADDTYDALNPKGRRRTSPHSRVRPEDLLLNQGRRDRMDSELRDVERNVSLCKWMIRRTLDYCCLWDFQPQTGDDGLDHELRELMARDCEAPNNDFVGRMSWDDMRRVAESLKITTGDDFLVPLREGTIQLVEGSDCRNPSDTADGNWLNGAKLNRRGRVTHWNFRELSEMKQGAWNYSDRKVKASNVWQHVQYEGRANTIRGMSHIQSSLNELRDIYETLDLARAKIKLEQLFGIAIFENPDEDSDLAESVNADGSAADDDDETQETHYDFGSGPVVMRRTVGEDVKLLKADSPGGNTQDFIRLCVRLTLLALDLPYSFLDSSDSNFFGSRAAWIGYERACHARRQSQLRLHHKMTRWRFWRWVLPASVGGTGEIVLPRSMTPADIRYRWTPRGVPWWKPQEELHAGLARVAAGLSTMQNLCDETGAGLYRENLRTLALEKAAAADLGFEMTFNPARLDVTLNQSKAT